MLSRCRLPTMAGRCLAGSRSSSSCYAKSKVSRDTRSRVSHNAEVFAEPVDADVVTSAADILKKNRAV